MWKKSHTFALTHTVFLVCFAYYLEEGIVECPIPAPGVRGQEATPVSKGVTCPWVYWVTLCFSSH
jgi:hypothetical protein